MQPTTPRNNLKTVATVIATIILAVTGLMVLLSAKAAPAPHGPIITVEKIQTSIK